MPLIEEFFKEIDAKWAWPGRTKIALKVLGSAALMLQAGYERGTKDGDVLETVELSSEIKARLLRLAGEGSQIHTRRRLYLDLVASGIPFLPQAPHWILQAELNASLEHFEIATLGVVDVVVSKLKRLNPNDADDIGAMIDLGLVTHRELISRFRLAVDYFACDARAGDLPRYILNLHRVERDMFAVDETEIELPGWI